MDGDPLKDAACDARMTMHSRVVDLGGPIHYADYGGSGRPIVLVHGLGGSHLNWLPVASRLAARGRVLAIDLLGHGRTPSSGRTARVGANRALLGDFLEEVAGEPAVLMGNSMGGYLCLAEAAAEPERIASLVLVDPALPPRLGHGFDGGVLALFAAMALPVVGEAVMRRHARLGPERVVRDTLALCCADPSRVPRQVYDAHVELARERACSGVKYGEDFLDAQRSLMAQLLRRREFHSMVSRIRARTLIVQGRRDRLVRLAAARALAAARPDWQFVIMDDVGHVPQLEAPERFLAIVEPWLAATAT